MPLLIIFILVPMAELAVLIKVGSAIGVLWTLALIFLTAIIGVHLLRQQGLATLMKANERMQQGALPAQELAEGFLLALAGALLLTPGFLTDAFGFSLLMPGVRGTMAQSIMKRFKPQVMNPFEQSGGQPGGQGSPFQQRPGSDDRRGGDVIEGDYKRED
ncbi:MAG: exlusion protein FxsA [Thalassolituus sp.]|nr:FxsA family protein [Pseudomonadota bacterium]MEC8104333.1 FxsA family protein [Pseudomonadota bacterium]TNC87120.1 MAG: exlusion protein FxsA [Thalassolituus sp.]